MTSFRIEELHPEIQRVVRDYQLDTSPNGAPDGAIDAADAPSIDAALGRLDRTAGEQARQDAALVRSLRPVTSNGLAVPRPMSVDARIRASIDARPRPGDAIMKLNASDLRGATVSERVEMIRHIVQGTGYGGLTGWFSGRVNNAREQRIMEIINTTPAHLRGPLVAGLYASPQLISQMEHAIDGAESRQFRDYIFSNIWGIETAGQAASIAHQVGIHSESNFLQLAQQLREHRGDAFADAVLVQLIAMDDVRALLPYVFWVAPTPTCENVSDLITEAAWEATLEATRQMHTASFNNLLQQLPPGQAARMLKTEFDQRHNIGRMVSGVNLAACAVGTILNSLSR